MNIVISDPKTGKAYSKKTEGAVFLNRKVNEIVDLSTIGLAGFKGKIRGGSDKQGFPMRSTVAGAPRKKIFAKGGVGFKPAHKGEKKRKSVRGNIISEETSQLNIILTQHGQGSLEEILGVKKTEKEEVKESAKEKAVKESLELVGSEAIPDSAEFKKKARH